MPLVDLQYIAVNILFYAGFFGRPYGTAGVPWSGPDHLLGNTDAKAVGEP